MTAPTTSARRKIALDQRAFVQTDNALKRMPVPIGPDFL